MTCKLSPRIGPSILNSDLSNLAEECKKLIDAGSDYLHLDVMDGHFVPNITFGAPVVKCLRDKIAGTYFDLHMMVDYPQNWIKDMALAGSNQYTFHLESKNDPITVIQHIKDANMKVGLAIKPKTKVEDLLPYIDMVDVVLIMTVEPGYGGQKFMEDMMPKVKFLRERFPYMDIEVDGGVNTKTIEACAKAGANMIVAGTSITGSSDPAEVIKSLKNCCAREFHK